MKKLGIRSDSMKGQPAAPMIVGKSDQYQFKAYDNGTQPGEQNSNTDNTLLNLNDASAINLMGNNKQQNLYIKT